MALYLIFSSQIYFKPSSAFTIKWIIIQAEYLESEGPLSIMFNKIGINWVFIKKEIITPDQSSITVDLWDIVGDKKYRSLAKIFYKDSNAILLVYDETDEDSFNELKNFWYEQVKDLGQILAVVANKCDLSDKKVKEEDGKKYAESIGAMFFEISAKENIGISNMFEKIAEAAKNKYNGN